MSTIKVDTVRPVTTDGSLTLQGDSSGAGVTGLVIDNTGTVITTNIKATTGQSLTIKDEDGNAAITIGTPNTAAITIGTDNTAAGYLGLNFGSYHGDSGGAGSGTLSANTLDDYEEGTWTPTNYTGGAVSGNVYTKIGRLVTVSAYFANVTFSGSTIGGLPFNSLTYGIGSIAYSDSTNLDGITSSGSNIQFRQDNASVTPNGSYLMLSITYQV